jgi:hypothetical protein
MLADVKRSPLARITNTTGSPQCVAVQSAWIEYMALPSPEMHTTGRSGRAASLTMLKAVS